MGIVSWMLRSLSNMRTHGISPGLQQAAYEFKQGAARRIDSHVFGTSIFELQWDVLILFDACRPDLLEEVADDRPFLPAEIDTIYSLASGSRSWMERNFNPEWSSEMARTAYVTGNPFSDEYLDAEEFELLDEVWEYAWDDDIGTIPPRPITDRAIEVGRNGNHDRLIIHYMQPHFPSIPDPLNSSIDIDCFGDGWESVWDDLKAGTVSSERVWKSYRANLEYVLDDVALLLNNLAAETVVLSADHGNAFGEFGFYGHPPYNPLPMLRRVPWVVTSATDYQTHEPVIDRERTERTDETVSSRLEDLGYL